MKAIIEIDLEIDGEWTPADKDTLEDMIFENAGAGAWDIDEERLIIFPRSMTVNIQDEEG